MIRRIEVSLMNIDGLDTLYVLNTVSWFGEYYNY
jgi:hypothetical protein